MGAVGRKQKWFIIVHNCKLSLWIGSRIRIWMNDIEKDLRRVCQPIALPKDDIE